MTSKIHPNPRITWVQAEGSVPITTSGGNGTITMNFTQPANSIFLGTAIRAVTATNSVNAVGVCLPIEDTETRTKYRIVSDQVQSVTVIARKYYLV